ncbi:uncharacterized protein LOC143297617 [Babylonia areolata]|uniref:uncharacterized protein LOC143297617 n=1 Tax=Babylonia areolata TaxID=304850 RepID=UPI003FD5FC62
MTFKLGNTGAENSFMYMCCDPHFYKRTISFATECPLKVKPPPLCIYVRYTPPDASDAEDSEDDAAHSSSKPSPRADGGVNEDSAPHPGPMGGPARGSIKVKEDGGRMTNAYLGIPNALPLHLLGTRGSRSHSSTPALGRWRCLWRTRSGRNANPPLKKATWVWKAGPNS